MSRYCPIVGHKVTYQFCDDCEKKYCKIVPRSGTEETTKTADNETRENLKTVNEYSRND